MDRRIHLPLYVIIVLILGSVATPAVAILASVRIAEENAARQLAAVQAERCDEYAGLIGVLEPAAPRLTPAGNGLLAYYRAKYVEIGCKPDK